MSDPGPPSRHTEVERKFDVPLGTAWPDLGAAPGVTRTDPPNPLSLEAVYFDTPAYDLAAHRVTLRRRTGGPDAGWHLKLPAGDARTELRAPLTPDGPPEELLDTVLAVVRDRPLVPVARIATDRGVAVLYGEDGAALAEFCDDRVTAFRLDPSDGRAGPQQQWREWEVELLDPAAAGSLDGVVATLLAAGAVPAGHESKLAKVLGEAAEVRDDPSADPVHRAVAGQVARLLEWDRAVRADADDAVHQMRVATRQIRSLLQASEDAFGLTDDAWILGELRELAAVLGTARDAEVLAERYRAALDGLPPELVRGPVAERLVEGARRQYRSGLRRSLTAMRSARYFRLLDALDALAASQPPASGPDDGPGQTTIAASYRRVRKAIKSAEAAQAAGTPADQDHALHRIRKAAKRLRYVAAATGDTGVERRSKLIQTLLGDHQDSVVSREHLLDQARAAHALGEDTFTYGVLYQQETDLAQRCREQLSDALKALRRSVRAAR